MAENHVLLIEDTQDLAELVKEDLERDGFKVTVAGDGKGGLQRAEGDRPDIVLLDMMLPDMNGIEVCRVLRTKESTRAIPIIFLTGKGDESDIVVGLGVGGDDYMTKPFRSRELMARIRAVLRRTAPVEATPPATPQKKITRGVISLDAERFEVKVRDRLVQLTLAEFNILWTLAAAPGLVFTRDQLLDKITKGDVHVVDRTIDVHVGAIRKKLGDDASVIQTIRGMGYKFQEA